MANPLKGEVEIDIAGATYTLALTSNAIVEAEQLLGGISIGEIALNIGRMENQRALLWAALQKHHKGLDLIKVGDLLDECEGGIEMVTEQLARALRFRISRIPVDQPLGKSELGDGPDETLGNAA